MFPVFKLASMRLADSPAISAAKRIVSIKSILTHKLTGMWMEDYGIASSSGLFNEQHRVWDSEVLSLLEVAAACFPQVTSRDSIAGCVSSQAAVEFALPEGIAVVNGTGDGFAAHLGSGCERSDRISVTLGTSAVVRQTMPRPVLAPAAGTFCYVADENVYLLGCAGSNGGNVLDWGHTVFGKSLHAQAGPDVPIFIPLLHGERSPEWDPGLTGSWYGLTVRHTAADLSRSILEGVIFNFGYLLDIVQEGFRCASQEPGPFGQWFSGSISGSDSGGYNRRFRGDDGAARSDDTAGHRDLRAPGFGRGRSRPHLPDYTAVR